MQTSMGMDTTISRVIVRHGIARAATWFMGIFILAIALAGLAVPNRAEAMSGYVSFIDDGYVGTNLGGMCANCHVDWGGTGIGASTRIDWNLYAYDQNFNLAAMAALDADNDGISNGAEYTKSISSTLPAQSSASPNTANNWFATFPDKDGDGCIQIFTRLGESGYFDVPTGITASNNFLRYSPRGWDVDDNDAAQGCSATWTNTSVPTAPGSTLDNTPPAAVGDFTYAGTSLVAAAIPLKWTATGDDGTTGTAHSYDLRYTTATLASASTGCGGACNVRNPSHWATMYNMPDVELKNGPAIWNAGTSVAPLMRAMYEPTPSTPGTKQACNALGFSTLCTANPDASYVLGVKGSNPAGSNVGQTNIITNGTTYWLAVRTSDGVAVPSGSLTSPGTFTENATLSNIVAVTAGTAGAAITSISPTTISIGQSAVSVTAQGFGLTSTNAAQMVLTNSAGTAVVSATGVTPGTTSVSGNFNTVGLAQGTYNLEVRTSGAVTKAAWVNAIQVTGVSVTVTSATPNSRGQGAASQNIAIAGTGFVNGANASFSGTGITVNSTTFNGSTSLTANIDIASGATTGLRDVTVTNPDASSGTLTNGFTVTQAPTHNCAPTSPADYGVAYNYSCTASLGITPYSWTVSGLPPGLSSAVSGANNQTLTISGTPNQAGIFVGSIRVTDANAGTYATTPSITINAVVPGAPTNVTAVPGNGSATVSFTPPASNGGAAITSYTVTSSPGGITASGSASPITVNGLTNNTAYTFTVTATNSAGTGPASSPSNSVTPTAGDTVPGAPTGVTAVRGNASATVSYVAPTSDGGQPIDRYTATCTSSTGGVTGSNFTPDGTVAPILVGGLTNGATYTCAVTARNSIGTGPASAESNSFVPATVPGAPTSVTAVAGNGKGTVSFSPPASDGGEAIIDYTANCTSSDGGAAGSLTAASSPITVTGLTNGNTYTCAVTARNAVDSGAASVSNSFVPQATAPDSAPTIIDVTSGGGSCTVSYAPPLTDGGSPITGYTATCTSGTGGVTGTNPDDAASPTTVTGLTADEAYTCTVAAKNAIGTGPYSSPSATCVPTVEDTTPPGMNLTPPPGTYYAPQTVSVEVTKDGTVYYTMDGSIPTTGSTSCAATTTAPCTIAVNTSAQLRLMACNTSNYCTAPEDIITANYAIILVDFRISSVSTTTSPVYAAGTMSVDATLVNDGSTASSTNTVIRYYLSTDNVITSSDILLTRYSVVAAGFPPGGNQVYTANVIVPATVVPGPYYIGAIADSTDAQPETNEINNAGASVATIPVTRDVDLVMTVLDTAETEVGAGHTFLALNTVQNQGLSDTTAPSTRVYFYLSTDNVITTTDIRIGLRAVGRVASGAENTASTKLGVPKNMLPGAYYYGAIVDVTGAQPETNEDNNTKLGTAGAGNVLTVTRKVDLVVTAISTDLASVGAGHALVVTSTEENQGTTNMTAPSNQVRFYLSTDNVWSSTDILLAGFRSVSGNFLKAGMSSTAPKTTTVPRTTEPGNYYVCAVADFSNAQIEEYSAGAESNNTFCTATTIEVIRDVDLVITAISTDLTSVGAGHALVVTSTEHNQGTTNMTAASNQVRFYLSTDNVWNSTDILLAGYRSVSGNLLKAGMSSTAPRNATVPKTTEPGDYYVCAVADFRDAQLEESAGAETNNTFCTATTIAVIRDVDLIVTSVEPAAASAVRGGSFVIDATERNQGTTNTTAYSHQVRFFLVPQATPAAAGTPLPAVLAFGSVPANTSRSGSRSARVPLTLPTGNYFVRAVADYTNAQPEDAVGAEDNNSTLSTSTIMIN